MSTTEYEKHDSREAKMVRERFERIERGESTMILNEDVQRRAKEFLAAKRANK